MYSCTLSQTAHVRVTSIFLKTSKYESQSRFQSHKAFLACRSVKASASIFRLLNVHQNR